MPIEDDQRNSYQVFFRTSKKFGKNPIPEVNSYITFQSLLQSFNKSEIAVIADNASLEQQEYFMRHSNCCYLTRLGNCGSFQLQVKLAIEKHIADVYYFTEDDHLHLPLQKQFLSAGLDHFDFVSLYDHPDKYGDWQDHGLMRKVIATQAGHFAGTPNTVMTFAIKRETLIRCADFFLQGPYIKTDLEFPQDHQMFTDLMGQGYSIGSCLPGRSTHCEQEGLSPYTDWRGYAKSLTCIKASNQAIT